jgi:hypothetical protein
LLKKKEELEDRDLKQAIAENKGIENHLNEERDKLRRMRNGKGLLKELLRRQDDG